MDELLEGVVVLDLSTVGPGSRCTSMLADFGADVLKVSRPPGTGGIEPPWFSYGAGRRTRVVRLDLKSDAGRTALLDLAATAHVLVESYRPGVAERLGIGYAAVSERNRGIVYASLTGYGADGPCAQWAGHDLNYLAVSGFLATQGRRADGGPALPGATVADSAGGGMHAALAIVAALYRSQRTSGGEHLDVAATEGMLSLMSLQLDQYLATDSEPGPGSTLLTGKYACYDVYQARDGGWLAVGAIETKFFANLCRLLGLESLAAAQYDDHRQDEVRSALRDVFATRDRDEWVDLLADHDTCVAPVLSVAEVTRHPHHLARNVFSQVEHHHHGRVRQVGPVLAGTAAATGPYTAPPDEVVL